MSEQIVACPNCGCDYRTARDLRAWKDEPAPSPTLEEALRGWQECAAELARVREEWDYLRESYNYQADHVSELRQRLYDMQRRKDEAEARLAALSSNTGARK